jgi:benzoyl-CoA reductase subunit C
VTAPVFENWKDCDLEGLLFECRELVDNPEYPTVRKWREHGGKVVGHFQVYFPEEIAHAAGFLPVKVCGAQVEAMQAESRFGSYLCSILKSSLELAISGRLELDFFVSHPICDAARNLAAIWGRNTDYPCQILYLPQNPNSRHSVTYLRDEYSRLLADLEEVAGLKVSDDDLRRSIRIFNQNRALLREIYAIKRETPWNLTADEAYVLTAVGGRIPREEHNDVLLHALHLLNQRQGKRQDLIRVVFEGGFCEQPPLDLLQTMSRSCYVVDDDLLIGMRCPPQSRGGVHRDVLLQSGPARPA